MRVLPLVTLLALSASAGACVEPAERGGAGECAGHAAESVNLVVRDERGAEVCDATVVVREGAFERALRAVGPAGGSCGWFGLPERPGTYEVTVARPGYETAVWRDVAVGVGADGCHVEPARVEVRLEPARGCAALAVPSFDVDVRDERGAPVCDATVVVRDGDFVQQLTPRAQPDGTCSWDGPFERPGTYEVTVTKAGFEAVTLRDVFVRRGAEECHVTPAEIAVTLEPAAVAPPAPRGGTAAPAGAAAAVLGVGP